MRFWRRASDKPFVLFFATDLHGSEKCFLKFLNAAKFYGADGLVLGGDLTGKGLVPIVQTGDGYRAEIQGRVDVAATESEVQKIERRVRFNGFYPHRCQPDELAQLQADASYRDAVFSRVMRNEVERWVAIADERVTQAGVPCVMMPGNDDDPFVSEVLDAAKVVRNVDGRIVEFGPYQVLGFGWSNPTPWRSPRELEEPQIASALRALARELDDPQRAIFNVHPPPHNSSLDLAPRLKDDLSFASPDGQSQLVPVGSTAVREVIAGRQPLLSLHGHVHESRGVARIGTTLCLNPGSEYNAGVLRGVLVRLGPTSVEGHQFVAG
jgi:Icc-related predicted phosphoesterase